MITLHLNTEEAALVRAGLQAIERINANILDDIRKMSAKRASAYANRADQAARRVVTSRKIQGRF